MIKKLSSFICQQCSYEFARWFGRCPECGEWNTAVETVTPTRSIKGIKGTKSIKGREISPVALDMVPKRNTIRIKTIISELDRVLGGGLVPGQVVLIAGEPGIGKSTLLLQVANSLGTRHEALGNRKAKGTSQFGNSRKKNSLMPNQLVPSAYVLYISGEESVGQIAIRAERLGIKSKNIQLLEETDIDEIIESVSSVSGVPRVSKANNTLDAHDTFDTPGTFLIVDSIQTMSTSDLSGMAGSVGQVRECAYRLVRLAKTKNIPVFIVGHVTKQGSIAGPSVLMHIVDTVLWFEGDKSLTTRMLRAVKNRFGPTDEVGIFSMEDKGLIPMTDPEKAFLTQGKRQVPGSVTTSIMEGTRPLLVEIQALVVPTKMAFPKRIAQGIDSKKLELLIAVLQRRVGLPIYEFDCFVNIAGGINLRNDPSVDLAVCMAIASAYFDKPVAKNTLAIGEVGLLGDIREVIAQEKRVKEAKRLGYKNVISTDAVKYLQEAIKTYLE